MNIITDPGKYEGEQWYVPEYWEKVLDGKSDQTISDDTTQYSLFRLCAEDAPVLKGYADPGEWLILWEDDQGFVHSRVMSNDAKKRFVNSVNTIHPGWMWIY